jgi:hypothetical protein
MTFGPANSRSSYLPTEFQVEGDEQFFRQLIAERERLTASILNIKEIAQYELQELLSGKQYFSTQAASLPRINRYGFRTTIDLVALNGGPIGAGATNLVLTTTTIPPAINGATIPLPSWGSATTATGVFIFINDPQVFVRFTPSTQTITITNNFGSNLNQCYFVLEYLKQ